MNGLPDSQRPGRLICALLGLRVSPCRVSYNRESTSGMQATASPSANMSESAGRQGAGSAQVLRGAETPEAESRAAEKPRASIATAIRPAWRNVWMSSPKVSAAR